MNEKSGRIAERLGLLELLDLLLRKIALWIGGLLILSMIFLTFAHVVRRYVFGDPIHGFVDLGQIMLVLVVAVSVAYSGRTGGQIAVELVDGFVSVRVLRVIEIIVRISAFVMISLLALRLAHDGPDAVENGETTTTLHISYEPFFYILALGMGLYAVVLIVEAFRLIRGQDIGREQARLFGADNDVF